MWWNFIGRTHEEIAQYREEWQAEGDRFGVVEGYVGKGGPGRERRWPVQAARAEVARRSHQSAEESAPARPILTREQGDETMSEDARLTKPAQTSPSNSNEAAQAYVIRAAADTAMPGAHSSCTAPDAETERIFHHTGRRRSVRRTRTLEGPRRRGAQSSSRAGCDSGAGVPTVRHEAAGGRRRIPCPRRKVPQCDRRRFRHRQAGGLRRDGVNANDPTSTRSTPRSTRP